MVRRLTFVLAALSLPATLLLGTPLHDWIDEVAGGRASAGFILWIGVLLCAAGIVAVSIFALRFLERVVLRARAKGLDELIEYVVICQQDGQQLKDEAADEQNSEVEFQHYCELARMLREHLELLWRGSDASIMALDKKGLDMRAAKALMNAAERHYDVEISGPLGTSPTAARDKEGRIKEAGFGGRCVALICSQLGKVLSEVRSDLGLGETRGTSDPE